MRFILNLLWTIFGSGLVLALEYAVVGLVCCLTIVGIPFGLQCFKLAGLALFPFGKDYDDGAQRGTGNVLLNIVWFIFAGVWIALTHLTAAIPLAVSIIGIPFALQHVKFALLAISPFGVRVRET